MHIARRLACQKIYNCTTRLVSRRAWNVIHNKWICRLSGSVSCSDESVNLWVEPEGHRTGIKVYNTLTKRKDELVLPHGKCASWYMCGPTVYDSAHIGHAYCYVNFDVIRRILTNIFGIDVSTVMCITDIDDKIIRKANQTGLDFQTVVKRYEQEFHEDMAALNVQPAHVYTRVTEFVPQIINYIQKIEERGHSYKVDTGSVYFDVLKYGKYGVFQKKGESVTTGNIAVEENKRHVQDFVLWKAAKPGEPKWDSPWGPGRPGWHIECSTMASYIFGMNLDIHTGGEDLKFPHHENELAQSRCYYDCNQWGNYWLHTGHLYLQNDPYKMSKSLQNVILVKEYLKKYTANQFRLFCMLTDYRGVIEYSDEKLGKACAILDSCQSFLHKCDTYIKGQLVTAEFSEAEMIQRLSETKSKVLTVLADDFNTKDCVDAVMSLINYTNSCLNKKHQSVPVCRSPGAVAAVSVYVHRILGQLGVTIGGSKVAASDETERNFNYVMDSLVHFRKNVRNYALNPTEYGATSSESDQHDVSSRKIKPLLQACDELRKDLSVININVHDYGQESSWKLMEGHSSSNIKTSSLPKKKKEQAGS
ncbi:hypothetical protein ACJMK2_032688 [Sinanodonta woodiana]|uniref:cysteine--tRNA ligase n=1 Tax=Sinanodonta woodiana TaxID=1069815 RepID=A0ABD3X4E2_SINWO